MIYHANVVMRADDRDVRHMRADQLVQLATQILFALIFLIVGRQALRRPWRVNIDIALLFGLLAILVVEGWISQAVGGTPGPLIVDSVESLLMALPYLLLRLVEDFTDTPVWLSRASAVGLAVIVVSFFVLKSAYVTDLTLLYVLYFIGLTGYVAYAFATAARQSSGVTRRRMQAVAVGTLSLGAVIVFAGIQAGAPNLKSLWQVLANLCALASGLAYFVGFAPPAWLRRAWQEPELRAFLGRAAALPRLPTTEAIVRALESGAALAIGTDHALIGQWDATTRMLRFELDGKTYVVPPEKFLAGRAFLTQHPVFSADTVQENPAQTELYQRYGSRAILAAPITAGERRLGVLMAYTAHAPIFAEDDLVLVALLADQAAVILESRALIDEAARVQAREEATRLKDDFLSAAAHDLKTPLTTVVAQAQLLAQRAKRNPSAPADIAGIERVIQEAQRLRMQVLELLDVSRVRQGKLLDHLEEVDLIELAAEACNRHTTASHPCSLRAPERLIGLYDRPRIIQLLDNLIENAIKYSPRGGDVLVTIEQEDDQMRLSVADHGIGVPASDLQHIFDRFYRGANVDDRQFAGLGLGLYICRGIVEQHGGRVSVTSNDLVAGSTFHVMLPLWKRSPIPSSTSGNQTVDQLADTARGTIERAQ
jgi:signal transduction histidine kinase